MIDYYTISSKNLKQIYNLDKPFGYYNFYNIQDEIKSVNYDTDNYYNIIQKIEEFNKILEKRKKREENIKKELEKLNVNFIHHSYLIRNYIMYNKLNLDYVIKTIYKMHILFTKLNIKQLWDEYLSENKNIINNFKNKDLYYDQKYNNYIQNYPEFKI